VAESWIKMRTNLADSPKVIAIADRIGPTALNPALDPAHLAHASARATVGALHTIWSIFDTHTTDGILRHYTTSRLDAMVGIPGFCDAMIEEGWLIRTDDKCLKIPRFRDHNGASAKRRAMQTRARADQRRQKGDNCRHDVAKARRQKGDQIRGEEIREEKKIPPPPGESEGEAADVAKWLREELGIAARGVASRLGTMAAARDLYDAVQWYAERDDRLWTKVQRQGFFVSRAKSGEPVPGWAAEKRRRAGGGA